MSWIHYQLKNRFQRLREDPIDLETEYCYLPTDDWEGVKCDDLPKWMHPLQTATWSPTGKERHLLEWTVCTVGSLILMILIMSRHKSAKKGVSRHPLPLVYLLAGLYHLYHYKFYIPLPERGWATTPCHLGWLIRLTMHFVPMSEPVADILRHSLLCFSSLAALFIFQPDGEVTDAVSYGMFSWSLIHHALLITIPVYDVMTGRVSILPPPALGTKKQPSKLKYFLKWHLISIAVYLLFTGTLFTPISLLSGVNWGWTLHFHATPLAINLGLTGPMYRPVWFGYCNFLFVVFRIMWLTLDYCLRESGLSRFSRSNMLRIQMQLQKNAKVNAIANDHLNAKKANEAKAQ